VVRTEHVRGLTLSWHLWSVNTLAKRHDEASSRIA
jgi:hypothetical protein